MNFRKMITLIEMLALTGVMSVGFSTWVIVETSFPEIQIKVETENVFNTNEYLEIKNIILSDYNEDGFYDEFNYNSSVVPYAYLYADLYINLARWRELNYNASFTNLSFDININSSRFTMYVPNNLECYHTSSSFSESFLPENPTALKNGNVGWKDEFDISYSYVSDLSKIIINLKYKIVPGSVSTLINNLKQTNGYPVTLSAEMSGGN